MFDSYNVRAVTEHTSVTREVHEHRAPTDQSVRLLAEMEDKALARVLDSVRLEGCEVDCVIHHMRDVMGMSDRFAIGYKLGEKCIRFFHDIRNWDRPGADYRQQVADELTQALAESIARELLKTGIGKASFKFSQLGRIA